MQRGFTLIEMLLVLALIGILSSVVFIMVGDSDDAKKTSVMSTAKSSLGFAQVCKFKGWDLKEPDNPTGKGGGDKICSGGSGDESLEEWAEITVDGCEYSDIVPGNWDYAIDCGAGLGKVECSASNGSCEWN
ncbi:MAG: type II secretion system protein [Patescibacteria group bacterium]